MKDVTKIAPGQQVQQVEPTTGDQALIAMIERVVLDPAADIDKLERILQLRKTVEDDQAKKAYDRDMSRLQGMLPKITKEGDILVNGQSRGKYARFEDILEQCRDPLEQCGFNITFRVRTADKASVEVTCVCAHQLGHREETSMTLPLDTSGSKNPVQAVGSSTSYGKRYTMCALLNINTAEDDNGVSGGGERGEEAPPRRQPKPVTQPPQAKPAATGKVTPQQVMWIIENLTKRKIPESEFLAHFQIGAIGELASDRTRDAKKWIEAWTPPPAREDEVIVEPEEIDIDDETGPEAA